MRTTTYTLAGSVPAELAGLEIPFNVPERDEEWASVVSDPQGDRDKLAIGNLNIKRQAVARDAANSEEVTKAIAEGDLDGARNIVLTTVAEYVYGARQTAVGSGTKAKAAKADKIAEAAANDPELAAKLAALGITL